jgi:hypothetical protein
MENYNRIEKDKIGIYYYLNNELHRLNGPACEYINGEKYWYQNGKLHRLDGPAFEYSTGTKIWYQNGKCHRIDGPAFEYCDGRKYWYYEGKRIECNSQEEFERYLKLKIFW